MDDLSIEEGNMESDEEKEEEKEKEKEEEEEKEEEKEEEEEEEEQMNFPPSWEDIDDDEAETTTHVPRRQKAKQQLQSGTRAIRKSMAKTTGMHNFFGK
ncbi:hypothetical protein ScalyP_jg1314 [Parmales sp. scaly parma]|nr:hypothetical protein ScalyP_jg1314 [Parmales sp. scaly parma]